MAFRPAGPHRGAGAPDSGIASGISSFEEGASDLDAALTAFERHTRELATCADALEQQFEQTISPRLRFRF